MTISKRIGPAFAPLPTGQVNAAQNLLNSAVSKAKDGATRDAIQKVWSRYVASYGKRRA
jgi:hypothetical protein